MAAGAGRTDGQHDSLLQFQGSSMDAEATGHPDSLSDYAGRGQFGRFRKWVLVLLAGTIRGNRCHATSRCFSCGIVWFRGPRDSCLRLGSTVQTEA